MIILKPEQILENYTFNIKWWNYNRVFTENAKSFVSKYFQKTGVYLEPIQTSKMEPFVKIVNGIKPLTNFTKSSILDVWLCSKNATKIFNKSLSEFDFSSFSSHLVKYLFLLLYKFLSLLIFNSDLQVLL